MFRTEMLKLFRDTLADQFLSRNDELVCTVVERAIEELRPSLRQISSMSVAEARGYVRARARRTVQKHVSLVAYEIGGLASRTEHSITSRSLEQVAHKVVREQWSRSPKPLGLRLAG